MENLLIYAWIVLVATMNFNFAYVYSGFTKVFDGLYKSGIEACVINYDSSGAKTTSYFSKDLTDEYVCSYFKENLKRYMSSYSLNIKYFEYGSGEENNTYPNEVDVYLTTYITYIGECTKSCSFYIGDSTSE